MVPGSAVVVAEGQTCWGAPIAKGASTVTKTIEIEESAEGR